MRESMSLRRRLLACLIAPVVALLARGVAIANVLLGVAHAGASVWAVGYYFTGTGAQSGLQRTLVERYNC